MKARKSVLIIDTPHGCIDCPFRGVTPEGYDACWANGEPQEIPTDVDILEECPLINERSTIRHLLKRLDELGDIPSL